jgi:hypothetical protein
VKQFIGISVAATSILVWGIFLGGCATDRKGLGDAPAVQLPEAPREVLTMPDTFSNVAMACDGYGHRIYVTTKEAPPVVVNDPTCPVKDPNEKVSGG